MTVELLIFLVALTVISKIGMVFVENAVRAYRDDMAAKPKRRRRLPDQPDDGEWVEMVIEDDQPEQPSQMLRR